MSKALRLPKIALATLAICYAVLVAGLALFQRRLLYTPDRDAPIAPPRAQVLRLAAADGVSLTAWFFPALAPASGYAVLFCHGNGGNLATYTEYYDALPAAGFAVLAFDYRGFGDSGGAPTEAGIYLDVRAALAALLARVEVDPRKVVYLGKSLGSGPATDLAAERAPALLVLETPFTSIADVARWRFPGLPVEALIQDRFDNLSKIARVRAPLLVIHGDRDAGVPLAQGRRLFERAREPKSFHVVAGAGHVDCLARDGAAYVRAIEEALGR